MSTFSKLFLLSFVLFFSNCNSKKIVTSNKTPLIPKDTTIKNERDNKLFVFVGEKLEITELPHIPESLDNSIKAKYRILQRVYGNFDKDTIEFTAYDHVGRFHFTEFKNALLYVSEFEGKLYHEKYQYDPVFKTRDGRWAGPYSNDYRHEYNVNTTVKPEKIDFADEVSSSIKGYENFTQVVSNIKYYKLQSLWRLIVI